MRRVWLYSTIVLLLGACGDGTPADRSTPSPRDTLCPALETAVADAEAAFGTTQESALLGDSPGGGLITKDELRAIRQVAQELKAAKKRAKAAGCL